MTKNISAKPIHYKSSSILRFLNTSGSDLFEKTERFHEYTETVFADRLWAYRICRLEKNGSRLLVETEFGERKWVLDCASNDYLQLSTDPEVIAATHSAVSALGVGAQGASMLNGNTLLHLELEKTLAQFLGKEAVLLSPSGYASMMSVMQGFLRPTDAVFYDRLCHSSLVDGMKLSGATMHFYPNRCVESLEKLLRDHRKQHRGAIVVTDGVFSAHGTIAPVAELVTLCRQYEAKLLVDDAHGIGTLNHGHGCAVMDGVDIVTGTLSKSLGACGGFVAGSKNVINYLRMFGNATCSTTNVSVANTAAALQSLRIIQREPERVKRLQEKVRKLRQSLSQMGIETVDTPAPIIALICGRDLDAWLAWQAMFNAGILLHALPFPIVPHGEALLRLRINLGLADKDLDYIANAIHAHANFVRPKKRTSVTVLASQDRSGLRSEPVPTALGEVVVHRKGKGNPVVFLHPLLFGSETYQNAFDKLPAEFPVFAIDWWGHGSSASIQTPVTLEQMAQCLKQVLDKAVSPSQPVTLVGTSMGGMIALRFAIAYPDLVSRLVLIGTSADEEEGTAKKLFQAMIRSADSLGGQSVLGDMLSAMFSGNFRDSNPGAIGSLVTGIVGKPVSHFVPCVNAVLDRTSICNNLSSIKAKTTIIVGDEDVAEPPAHSQILSELIPNAKLIVVPNCGHLLPVEKPSVLVDTLSA